MKDSFHCVNSFHYSILSPHHGFAGKYTRFTDTTCPGTFIHGVAIENYEGGMLSDERGATNLKMYCSDGTKLEANNNDKRYVNFDSKQNLMFE